MNQHNPQGSSNVPAHLQGAVGGVAPHMGESYPVAIPAPSKLDNWINNRSQALEYLQQNPGMLSVEFLLENNLPVYVRNNTGNGSVLLFNMLDASGRRIPCRIEKTPLPFKLSDQFDTATLLQSPEFRNNIYKSLLVLVNPEQAEAEMKSPIAQAYLAKNASRVSASANNLSVPRSVDPSAGSAAVAVSERMKSLVLEIQKGALKGDDAVLNIFGSFKVFNSSDFSYFYSQLGVVSVSDDPVAQQRNADFNYIVEAIRTEAIRQGIHR